MLPEVLCLRRTVLLAAHRFQHFSHKLSLLESFEFSCGYALDGWDHQLDYSLCRKYVRRCAVVALRQSCRVAVVAYVKELLLNLGDVKDQAAAG